jgi:hypothetical protein
MASDRLEKTGRNRPAKRTICRKLIIMTVMAVAMVASVSRGMVGADDGKKVDIKGLETSRLTALSKQPEICPGKHQGRQRRHGDLE